MKKFFKIFGIVILSVVVLSYLAFLFVLPNVIDLNKFKPDLQKLVKEQANLNLDFNNPKITVTPLLSAGVKVDDIKVTLPDNSEVLTADSFCGRISVPSLLLLTVKVSKAELIHPVINLDIANGQDMKLIQALEPIILKKEENIEETPQEATQPIIDVSLIKILVPKVRISDYEIKVNDLKTSNFLKLRGDELLLGYMNGKTASAKTNAELFVNDKKNINANIDIDTIIPAATKLDEEDDKAQTSQKSFINPVEMYMQYDLKANIDSKIKIRNGKYSKKIVSKGYFNVDNFTLKLAQLQLPESKLHVKTSGTKADLDSTLFITDEDNLSLLGKLDYGKNPSLDMNINSTEIQLDNVLNLAKATMDSFDIQNDLALVKGEGHFKADAYIKTNFKKLESDGSIVVRNCVVKSRKNNAALIKANSIISLKNSVLKFVDTIVEVAGTSFKIGGTIDEKSVADINVDMEKLPVSKVFTMFLPAEINNVYAVNSGDINLKANIAGELKNAMGKFILSVSNLDLTDKVNKIKYTNSNLKANFSSDFKTFKGDVQNTGFKLLMNGAAVTCDKLSLDVGDKDIVVTPSQVKINYDTLVNLGGSIKNYIKNPEFNFKADGNLSTKDLKQLFGKDLAKFIDQKGVLPVSAEILGDQKKQTLKASIEANSNNYITPLTINNVLNKNTVIQAVVDFKGDRLKIKDTGFYIKNVVANPDKPDEKIVKLTDIISVDGTITKLDTNNPNINLLKIKIPNELSAIIYAFPKSSLKTKGNIYLYDSVASPKFRGDVNIYDIKIPELLLSIANINAKFEGKDLDLDVKNALANGSDYNAMLKADLNLSNVFVIKSLDIISKLTDADKVMAVSDAAMKYFPSAPASNGKGSSSSSAADIPVVIRDGSIDIKHIKSGTINLYDTTGKISLNKNIFYLNNLVTSAFDGKIKGDVSMNLLSGLIKANVNGNGLDVEKTLLEAAAMKDTLTGTMNFDAQIGLSGTTYEEQMKTLLGTVNFEMKNGSLGPFGKLENLIMAENIRESKFFETSIGAILKSMLSFDTAHYNTLNGTLNFKDGVTDINSIKSSGDIMATYIFGNFNLLTNKLDIKLRGRLGSQVSDSMGVLSYLNPINLAKATPGMSYVLGKMFFLFTEVVTQDEMNIIPDLGKIISDNSSTKFQVVLRGDVAKPVTLVKSFKWLALQTDIDNAQEYVNSIKPEGIPDLESFGITSTDPAEIKEQVKEVAKQKVKDAVTNSMSEETKQAIKDTQKAVETTKQNVEKAKQDVAKAKETVNSIKETINGNDQAKKDELKKQALSQLQKTLNKAIAAKNASSTAQNAAETTQEAVQE